MTFEVRGRSADETLGICLSQARMLRFDCAACERGAVRWGLEELRRLPVNTTVGEIAARARCASCGSDRGVITFEEHRVGVRRAWS